ncbi:ATP-binding protein [Roseofilum reptotaenium]
MGLGITIAHQIIEEKHEGTIDCYSQISKGTEFMISLPFGNSNAKNYE